MGITVYSANKLQELRWGNRAWTPPATIYFAVHLATNLSLASLVNDTAVILDHTPALNAKIIIDPYTANQEERTVIGISGSGAYTATLSSPLTLAHALGVLVLVDPGLSGEAIREPSGLGYTRVSLTNNSALWSTGTSGRVANLTSVSIPNPSGDWGWATHGVFFDASTVGNCLEWGRINNRYHLDTAAVPVSIPIGNIVSILIGSL